MAYITAANGSRQPMFLVTTGILFLLSTIAVSLRLYRQISYVRHVGLDDYFMAAALIVAIGMGVQNGLHVSWDTGQHGVDLDFAAILVPTLKYWYAYQMVHPWSLFFVIASTFALYHRMFTQTKFWYTFYAISAFVTIYTIVVFFVNAFECRSDPSRAWTPTFPQECNKLPATYFSTASINILTDAMILIMPLRTFGQLNLHQRKRWALLGFFMVGGIAFIASIARLYALYVYTIIKYVAYNAIFILLFSQIEVNVTVISASASALRPLFNKAIQSSSYNQSNNYSYDGSEHASNLFSGHRSCSNGQMELHLFGKNDLAGEHKSMEDDFGTRNTSEEHILGDEGITKTVETNVNVERNQGERVRAMRTPF